MEQPMWYPRLRKRLLYPLTWLMVVHMIQHGVAVNVTETLKFNTLTASLSDTKAIGCAIEQFNIDLSTIARYDGNTGECESLQATWYSGVQVQDGISTYVGLSEVELTYSELTTMINPAIYFAGVTVVAYVQTTTIDRSAYGVLVINFQRNDPSLANCMHLDVLHQSNQVAFLTYVGGAWTYQFVKSGVTFQSNTLYKFEFRITESAIEIYINDTHFETVAHVRPIEDCDLFICGPGGVSTDWCKTIQMIY